MNILPAIDIRHGKVVQLVGGDPDQVAVTAERNPSGQAKHWHDQGAKRIHVVDLDGAIDGKRQWHHLGGMQHSGIKIQFGGGVRSMLDVQKLVDMGIDRIVIGTQGIQNPDWLAELARLFPGVIVLAIDARGRDVQVKGWTESAGLDVVDLARKVAELPLAGLLYTNVEKEGRMEGIDTGVVHDIRDAAPALELIVSGGISNMDDLDALATMGVHAVVLGMSVYTGAIDLAAAIERFEVSA